MELHDLLSLDNSLLVDYKMKDLLSHPENVLRLPWFCISQVLTALEAHLIVRPFHGVYTMYWKHAVFCQIVSDKYLSNCKTNNLFSIQFPFNFLIK